MNAWPLRMTLKAAAKRGSPKTLEHALGTFLGTDLEGLSVKSQSGRQDSNLRPSAPKTKGTISGPKGALVIAAALEEPVLPCPAQTG